MATMEEKRQEANRNRPEPTPFADTWIRSREECPHCFSMVVKAISKNGKEMWMDAEPVRERKRGATGWSLGLVVHEGETRLRAKFLNPFDREYALERKQPVFDCHFDTSPGCKEAKAS